MEVHSTITAPSFVSCSTGKSPDNKKKKKKKIMSTNITLQVAQDHRYQCGHLHSLILSGKQNNEKLFKKSPLAKYIGSCCKP